MNEWTSEQKSNRNSHSGWGFGKRIWLGVRNSASEMWQVLCDIGWALPSLFLSIHPPEWRDWMRWSQRFFPMLKTLWSLPSPTALVPNCQPLSVPPDSELIRPTKAPVQFGEGLLLPCLVGLKAILSKFSRNGEKAQRLLLKPSGQVSLRTRIKFVSVDLSSSWLPCLGTASDSLGFILPHMVPSPLWYPCAVFSHPCGAPLIGRIDPKRRKQILIQAGSQWSPSSFNNLNLGKKQDCPDSLAWGVSARPHTRPERPSLLLRGTVPRGLGFPSSQPRTFPDSDGAAGDGMVGWPSKDYLDLEGSLRGQQSGRTKPNSTQKRWAEGLCLWETPSVSECPSAQGKRPNAS